MRKLLFILFVLLPVRLYAQYIPVEQFTQFYTQVTYCSYDNKSYVLIVNGYEDLPQYLVIYEDNKYTARQVYGEILLKYYAVKNSKKEYKMLEGNWYSANLDNSQEEVLFLMSLTNEYVLMDYYTFFYSDDNSSKDELLQFYDRLEGEEKEVTIGSSAGVLMGIYADDFVTYIRNYK